MNLITSFLIVLFQGSTPESPARSDEGRSPNVIVIMADDLGRSELGCTGSQRIRTPHIDRLREHGMLFTQAYSGSTVCAPSRCTLLTGQHTGHAQIRDNYEEQNYTDAPGREGTERIGAWKKPPAPSGRWGGQLALRAETNTLARTLGKHGYATCGVGKWGLGGPGSTGHPNLQGFDHWFGYLCQRNAHNYYPTHLDRNGKRFDLEGNDRSPTGVLYATDLMVDDACEFIDRHADDPFFLYYATPVPHLALQVPDDSLAEYQGLWDDPPYPGGAGYLPHAEPRAAYAAMVTRFDRNVGRLVERLQRHGLLENTIIFLTSDNGSTFNLGGYDPEFFDGTGGLRGAKTYMYEGGIRVPLIVTWPGHIAPGSTSNLVVANWDLFPTTLGLVGVTAPEGLDGIDIAPTLLGHDAQRERDWLYWEYHSRGGMQVVRLGEWKGIRLKAHGTPDAPIELYDLSSDPNETRNVASLHPEVVARMSQIMRDARTESAVPRWNFSPAQRARKTSSDEADS